MRAQVRGLEQAERNILDGISLIQTAESGLTRIHEYLQRARDLSVQAANDTLTDKDRQILQEELSQILSGIDEIAYNTDFNQIKLLIGTYALSNISSGNQGENDSAPFIVNDQTINSETLYTDNIPGSFTVYNQNSFNGGNPDIQAMGILKGDGVIEEPIKFGIGQWKGEAA